MLAETLFTVYRSALFWNKGHFTFFAAVSACSLVHFSWPIIETAEPAKIHTSRLPGFSVIFSHFLISNQKKSALNKSENVLITHKKQFPLFKILLYFSIFFSFR